MRSDLFAKKFQQIKQSDWPKRALQRHKELNNLINTRDPRDPDEMKVIKEAWNKYAHSMGVHLREIQIAMPENELTASQSHEVVNYFNKQTRYLKSSQQALETRINTKKVYLNIAAPIDQLAESQGVKSTEVTPQQSGPAIPNNYALSFFATNTINPVAAGNDLDWLMSDSNRTEEDLRNIHDLAQELETGVSKSHC